MALMSDDGQPLLLRPHWEDGYIVVCDHNQPIIKSVGIPPVWLWLVTGMFSPQPNSFAIARYTAHDKKRPLDSDYLETNIEHPPLVDLLRGRAPCQVVLDALLEAEQCPEMVRDLIQQIQWE